jgi:hypothetical protein
MSYQTQPESAGLTRRKVIVTGVSAAAAGVVIGAGATIAGSQLTSGEADASEASEGAAAPKQPVMIHLRDAGAGHFDVFVGTERAQVTDRGFAARLSSAVAEIEGR